MNLALGGGAFPHKRFITHYNGGQFDYFPETDRIFENYLLTLVRGSIDSFL